MPKKFLIIQTAFLGDVVLATPLIEKLRSAYPDAQIDFLLRKGNESLLNAHPYVHRVLVFDKQSKLGSMRMLIAAMRVAQYDLLINLHRFASSGLLAVLSGARVIHGFSKNPFSFLYTTRFEHRIGVSHEVERNLALLEGWTDTAFARPQLYPPPEAGANRPTSDYVCIAPTSVWFTKQWPPEKWVSLINRFPANLTVVLLGAPADRAICTSIGDASGRSDILNMAGKLTLLESAAWMQGARMNYANDSAPIHLASAVDAPITAIFCSTVPAFGFTPLSTISSVVEVNGALSCRPCGLHGYKACPQGHFKCAQDIEVDQLEPEKVGVD